MKRNNKQILFASNNRGKYDELAKDFKDVSLDLVFYSDIDLPKLDLPEDSEIMAVNAYEKAAAAAEQTGYYALGDDSGIFITALDYFPGVHSRRWSGAEEDDLGRNKRIIDLMSDVDGEDREAYLISRFSLVSPEGTEIYKTVVKNKFYIAREPRGDHGFGYDSILEPTTEAIIDSSLERVPELLNDDKLTVGMLTQEEKNAVNNRGRIAKEIAEFLSEKDKN